MSTDPKGPAILVVEDDWIVARDLADMLVNNGYRVVGPVSSTEFTPEQLAGKSIDAALLDTDLGGGRRAFTIASGLAEQGIPYGFLTGYATALVPSAHRNRPRLQKPLMKDDLLEMLKRLVATPAG